MLAAAMLCLASLAQAPPGRPAVLRGTVVEQGTKRPLAGVSVRVGEDFDAPSVTTDAKGRFDGLPADANGMPAGGQFGPLLRLRAEDDRAWPWSMPRDDAGPAQMAEHRRRQAVWAVYEHQTISRWQGEGPQAGLVVECPPVGVIEAVVRGPDGRLLADTPIALLPGRGFPSYSSVPVHLSGRTDHAGSFRIREFQGLREFGIQVAGLGFGSTGPVEVVAGKPSRPEIPPLARFGRIEGRVADALKRPGVEVVLGSPFGGAAPSVPCDEEGRFAIADVVPGNYQVSLRAGGQAVPSLQFQVRVGPGEVARDLVVSPPPPTPPEVERMRQRMARQMNPDPNRTIVWVEGTARDEQGRPLAGATVYARLDHAAMFRQHIEVKKTTTDAEGRYRFEGPAASSQARLSVLVAAKGRPPLLAHAPGPDLTDDPAENKPTQLDLTVGARGGSLAVRLLQDGRKAPGASVRLSSPSPDLTSLRHPPPDFPGELGEMTEILAPTAVAGADGVARFENLAPGVYDAAASPGVDPGQPFAKMAVQPGVAIAPMGPVQGETRGIEIAPGGRAEATIVLTPESTPVRFRLLDPDGAPVAGRHISIRYSRGHATVTTSAITDPRGECSVGLDPGRWTLDVRYQDAVAKSRSTEVEPFYQAEAQVASSPALADAEPIILRAARRERGALKVRLLGRDGAPARGGVAVFHGSHSPGAHQAGTVDEGGWIRFADMASGKYRLRGFIEGSTTPPRPQPGRRLADEELADQAMILDREATVEPGAEAVVELRMEPVGYVRATIRPPAGGAATNYTAWVTPRQVGGESPAMEVSEDRASYLIGPLPAGPWPLRVMATGIVDGKQPQADHEVVAEPGRVSHVEVDAPPGEVRAMDERSWRLASLGEAGASLMESGPGGEAVTVVLADGATPAFGAWGLFIPAGGPDPALTATADAAGRLTWSRLAHPSRMEGDKVPEPADEPTIVAWAPGIAGPVVATVDPAEPLRLTLPAPAAASGRVATAGRDARIRVVLAVEGQGPVAAAMRRETMADADGRFRFPALAPGRYVVQAVRDELWASKPVPMVVEPGRESRIDLDIPAPGATVALELVDRHGEPIAAAFSIKPPAGPIADLAPIVGRTDEAGRATLRGLPTGLLALGVEGVPSPLALDVPPASPGAGPLGVRVEVARQGP